MNDTRSDTEACVKDGGHFWNPAVGSVGCGRCGFEMIPDEERWPIKESTLRVIIEERNSLAAERDDLAKRVAELEAEKTRQLDAMKEQREQAVRSEREIGR